MSLSSFTLADVVKRESVESIGGAVVCDLVEAIAALTKDAVAVRIEAFRERNDVTVHVVRHRRERLLVRIGRIDISHAELRQIHLALLPFLRKLAGLRENGVALFLRNGANDLHRCRDNPTVLRWIEHGIRGVVVHPSFRHVLQVCPADIELAGLRECLRLRPCLRRVILVGINLNFKDDLIPLVDFAVVGACNSLSTLREVRQSACVPARAIGNTSHLRSVLLLDEPSFQEFSSDLVVRDRNSLAGILVFPLAAHLRAVRVRHRRDVVQPILRILEVIGGIRIDPDIARNCRSAADKQRRRFTLRVDVEHLVRLDCLLRRRGRADGVSLRLFRDGIGIAGSGGLFRDHLLRGFHVAASNGIKVRLVLRIFRDLRLQRCLLLHRGTAVDGRRNARFNKTVRTGLHEPIGPSAACRIRHDGLNLRSHSLGILEAHEIHLQMVVANLRAQL